MSTASPDTWEDLSGADTQRAASSSDPYSRDRLAEQLLLVRPGTPTAVDVELDPVARRIRPGAPKGREEDGIEVGHCRDPIVGDRHAIRDSAVRQAEHVARIALPAKGRDRSRRYSRGGRQLPCRRLVRRRQGRVAQGLVAEGPEDDTANDGQGGEDGRSPGRV